MIKVGILTSGGDCQGLNGAMYGLVKGLTETNKDKVEIYGILDGYTGLINGDYKKMKAPSLEIQDNHLRRLMSLMKKAETK